MNRPLVTSDDPRVIGDGYEWTCTYDTVHDVDDVCRCDESEDAR